MMLTKGSGTNAAPAVRFLRISPVVDSVYPSGNYESLHSFFFLCVEANGEYTNELAWWFGKVTLIWLL